MENQWYFAWRHAGRNDLAKQTLAAFLRFTCTSENYLCERYMETAPWYLPWSPNASASGRLIAMLYNARKNHCSLDEVNSFYTIIKNSNMISLKKTTRQVDKT